MAALVAAAGFRSSTGALLEPLEAEFGWSRATTSGAVSLNLVVYGLTAPFAAALMERFGMRRVVAVALRWSPPGSGLTLVMTEAWQLWLLWGFAVGIGTGSLALVFGAIVANRWFVRHRGAGRRRLLGGELHRPAGLPARDRATSRRARLALGGRPGHASSRCCSCRWSGWCSATIPPTPAPRRTARSRSPAPLRPALRAPAPPGSRSARCARRRAAAPSGSCSPTFWICGWSTNGLIGTHFIPAAHDHGMPATTAPACSR